QTLVGEGGRGDETAHEVAEGLHAALSDGIVLGVGLGPVAVDGAQVLVHEELVEGGGHELAVSDGLCPVAAIVVAVVGSPGSATRAGAPAGRVAASRAAAGAAR